VFPSAELLTIADRLRDVLGEEQVPPIEMIATDSLTSIVRIADELESEAAKILPEVLL
jgi:hypothetical protein